jgi:gliding motility-associated-like protein
MKKYILLIFCSFFYLTPQLFATETLKTSGSIVSLSEMNLTNLNSAIDDVFFITDEKNFSIHYEQENEATIEWYQYSIADSDKQLIKSETTSKSTLNQSQIEGNKGYLILVNGVTKTRFWIIKINQNDLNQATSVSLDKSSINCSDMSFTINSVTRFPYYFNNKKDYITLPYTIEMENMRWNETEKKWDNYTRRDTLLPTINDDETSMTIIVDSILKSSYLHIVNSPIAEGLELPFDTISSDTIIQAITVEIHPTATISEREGLNELDRKTEQPFGGSAPLVVDLKSNANIPIVQQFEWHVYDNDRGGNIPRFDSEFRHTFEQPGLYSVSLIADNGLQYISQNHYCFAKDSTITITILESDLQIPNAFSPNGDGINDEFRVAFKSLAKFNCWIYNRWGRQLYHWTDPTKGWDGTIGSQKAEPGAYYYVIEAVGTDGKEYWKRGNINLFRK